MVRGRVRWQKGCGHGGATEGVYIASTRQPVAFGGFTSPFEAERPHNIAARSTDKSMRYRQPALLASSSAHQARWRPLERVRPRDLENVVVHFFGPSDATSRRTAWQTQGWGWSPMPAYHAR